MCTQLYPYVNDRENINWRKSHPDEKNIQEEEAVYLFTPDLCQNQLIHLPKSARSPPSFTTQTRYTPHAAPLQATYEQTPTPAQTIWHAARAPRAPRALVPNGIGC